MLFWSTFDESTGVKTSFSVSKLELVWCALRERERYLTVFLVRFDLEIYLYSSTATQKMKYTTPPPPPKEKKRKNAHMHVNNEFLFFSGVCMEVFLSAIYVLILKAIWPLWFKELALRVILLDGQNISTKYSILN